MRQQLGVLFGGDKGLYNQLNAIENMRYFGRLYGMDDEAIERRAGMLLDRVQLADRASERVESYSRGMKQRLHIAKTLIHDPAVVILDEPTIGLDPGRGDRRARADRRPRARSHGAADDPRHARGRPALPGNRDHRPGI